VAGVGAYLGGHLSYAPERRHESGGGVNQAAPGIARPPAEWTSVAELAEPPDGNESSARSTSRRPWWRLNLVPVPWWRLDVMPASWWRLDVRAGPVVAARCFARPAVAAWQAGEGDDRPLLVPKPAGLARAGAGVETCAVCRWHGSTFGAVNRTAFDGLAAGRCFAPECPLPASGYTVGPSRSRTRRPGSSRKPLTWGGDVGWGSIWRR
jgi:hypothetical protein